MSDRKVAVCGLPRSGNRLIQRMLQRHGFVAEVRHYGMIKPFRNGGVYPYCAVWVVRDLNPWRRSCLRDWAVLPRPLDFALRGDPNPDDLVRIHGERTLRLLIDAGVPVLPVSYERIVDDPDRWGRCIVSFSAAPSLVEWRGWGEDVTDGNAKWRTSQG